MGRYALLARLEAKSGKEEEVAAFLAGALPLAQAEPGTQTWFAWRIGASTFGIFDTFERRGRPHRPPRAARSPRR